MKVAQLIVIPTVHCGHHECEAMFASYFTVLPEWSAGGFSNESEEALMLFLSLA